jgi:hypothetical protein
MASEELTIEELKEFQEKSLYKKGCLRECMFIFGVPGLLMSFLLGHEGSIPALVICVLSAILIAGGFLAGKILTKEFTRRVKKGVVEAAAEGMFDQSQVNRSFFTKKSKKRHLFTTGDPEFDSIFACSGQNEQEAMTLLTPAIRKRLIRLYRDVNLPMIIGWKDNMLHFIVQNAYVPFGYELNRTIDYKTEIAEMRKKLLLTRRVVDELIMSRSIFSEYALEEYSYSESTGFDGGLQRQ